MRYLMREAAILSGGQWEKIDQAVVSQAKKELVGRRFLSVAGPLGARVQNVPLDVMDGGDGAAADFWAKGDTEPVEISSRRFLELATVYADFIISWRDIEDENAAGVQAAMDAASSCARREDDLIFYGDKDLGIEGLLTAKGVTQVAMSDWNQGENPVQDVAKAMAAMADQGCTGERALVVGTDLYAKLYRIQPGTGMMEIDRVKGMVEGKLFRSTRLEKGKAVLVHCDPNNVDLVIGQDLVTAYTGNDGLDHTFRVMETIVPRIKRPCAVAVIA